MENKISEIIKGDEYYSNSSEGSVEEIAKFTEQVFDMFNGLDDFKMISSFEDEVYFKPDDRLLEREKDFEFALIKYSAHFVTKAYATEVKRSIDFSKIKSLNKIFETITDAEYRILSRNKND